MRHIALATVLALASAAPAAAQVAEVGYPRGSLGFEALASADYATAERQLRSSAVRRNDPALLINIGQVYARTGRSAEAAEMFRRALRAREVQLLLASGHSMSSRDAASRALRALEPGADR